MHSDTNAQRYKTTRRPAKLQHRSAFAGVKLDVLGMASMSNDCVAKAKNLEQAQLDSPLKVLQTTA